MKKQENPIRIRRKIWEKVFRSFLDESRKLEIVRNWVVQFSKKSAEPSGNCDQQLRMCISDLELGWEMILRVLSATNDKSCLCKLGCWHLEDWLALHREKVLERVEVLAGTNIMFGRLLSCVYQNSLSDAEYKRISAVAVYDNYFNE